MESNERLEQAYKKIEERKRSIRGNGIPEPSKGLDTIRDFISPVFRKAVGIVFPKCGGILLGETKPNDIKRLTSEYQVIYSPAHRGTFDIPRFIAHGLPHIYPVIGDERVFYCTPNEGLLKLNGILYFDREDPEDRKSIIDVASKVLESGTIFEKHHAIMVTPEGVPNVYGRENLKLFPGIIKIALNTGAVIVPLGNEIHIIWDKKGNKIIKDINYMMYENYREQALFRPSDDKSLLQMYQELKKENYYTIAENKDMERFIYCNRFGIRDINFDLDGKLIEFLDTHPVIKEFVAQLQRMDGIDIVPIIEYLKRCTIVKDLNDRQIICLNKLDQRMRVLSKKINAEIDQRHPKTREERERDSREYIKFYLENVEKSGKKGTSTAYAEIDRHINQTTEEKIINSETKKVLEGLNALIKNDQIYNCCHDYAYTMATHK